MDQIAQNALDGPESSQVASGPSGPEIVDPGVRGEPQKDDYVVQGRKGFLRGNPGRPPRDPRLGRGPKKNGILQDLEWAYRNIETNAKPKNAQQELFRGDFIQDREKTLKMLIQLQKEHRERVRAWQQKMEEEKAKRTTGSSGGGHSIHGGGELGPDEAEERVREMMKRLLEEAAHGEVPQMR